MKNWLRICTLLCMGFAAQGYALTVCTQGELTRTVSVVYTTPGQEVPCEVLYEKPQEGEPATLWRAQNEAGYCEARAEEFIDKLTGLGWDCADAEDAEEEATAQEASDGDG